MVRVVQHPMGRRVYIFERRVHHGAVGLALAFVGGWLIHSDIEDWPFWPSREV